MNGSDLAVSASQTTVNEQQFIPAGFGDEQDPRVSRFLSNICNKKWCLSVGGREQLLMKRLIFKIGGFMDSSTHL
jgi:hypothetical protein